MNCACAMTACERVRRRCSSCVTAHALYACSHQIHFDAKYVLLHAWPLKGNPISPEAQSTQRQPRACSSALMMAVTLPSAVLIAVSRAHRHGLLGQYENSYRGEANSNASQ